MPQANQISGTHQVYAAIASQATAATDDNFIVWQTAVKCQITSVTFIPAAAVTADPTNFSIYTLTRYTAGASATTVATRTWAATNSANHVPEAFTLSATAANLLLAADDTLEIVKTHGGTGLVIPDGTLIVRYLLTGS